MHLTLDLEGVADLVQEGGKGPVIRGLLDPGTVTAVLPKFFKVGFQGIHRVLTRALCHGISYLVNSFLKKMAWRIMMTDCLSQILCGDAWGQSGDTKIGLSEVRKGP
jgi:hypothetical protein